VLYLFSLVDQRLDALWGDARKSLVKRIRLRSSDRSDGLQAVDMVGGAIYRWLTDDDQRFVQIIQPRTLMWEFRSTNNLPI
jgi:hypothetical protein